MSCRIRPESSKFTQFPISPTKLYSNLIHLMAYIQILSDRTTRLSVVTTRAWQPTSTKVSCLVDTLCILLIASNAAMVEPDAMPGQTNFIAGFTQCK